MPSFGWQLDDTKVAAALTYVRNAWGFGGAAVSPEAVTSSRSALSKRQD
jgi:mono/diheme cytochrome c family protein